MACVSVNAAERIMEENTMSPEYFLKFYKLFADNYLKMSLWGVFQVKQNHYAVEMANGYAEIWEVDWEEVTEIGDKMVQIGLEFDEDGELIGLSGVGFRGKFVKVLAKIGVCV